MESNRQKKIAGILQQDLAEVLQAELNAGGVKGVIISVSKIKVTSDLSIAKAYLSIFPNDKGKVLIDEIRTKTPVIKHELAQRTRHQLRRMPQLEFFIDDSLEYMDRIDRSLKGEENPIKNPNLLDKRKKS